MDQSQQTIESEPAPITPLSKIRKEPPSPSPKRTCPITFNPKKLDLSDVEVW